MLDHIIELFVPRLVEIDQLSLELWRNLNVFVALSFAQTVRVTVLVSGAVETEMCSGRLTNSDHFQSAVCQCEA